MISHRPLIVFTATLLLGAVLALFSSSQLAIVLVLVGLVVVPVVTLVGYVVLNGLPRGAKRREFGPGALRGLGTTRWLVGLTLAAIVLFAAFPGLDLWIAGKFYSGGNHFAGQGWFGGFLRWVGYTLPFVVLAVWILSWIAARLDWPTPFEPAGRDVLFLTLAMIIGPGLVVNLAMKDHLHRPRPAHLAEFGGGKAFRAFYQFDGACMKNCAFPSGESAEAFWMLAPASLAPPPWRAQAIGAALAFGGGVSLLRMAFGGHFLSDVIFAALVMWAILLVLRRLLYRQALGIPGPRTPRFALERANRGARGPG